VLTTQGLQTNVVLTLWDLGNALCLIIALHIISVFVYLSLVVFSSFSIDDEESLYRLHYAGYQGTAGNAMTHQSHDHNNKPFTTVDRDNDK